MQKYSEISFCKMLMRKFPSVNFTMKEVDRFWNTYLFLYFKNFYWFWLYSVMLQEALVE